MQHDPRDAPALARAVADCVGEPVTLASVPGGDESAAYVATGADRKWFVRLAASDRGFRKDAMIARWLAGTAIPIPAVHEIGRLGQKHYCLSAFVEGRTVQSLDATDLAAIVPAIADLHDSMAAVVVPIPEGYGPIAADGTCAQNSWPGYLAEEISRARSSTSLPALNPGLFAVMDRLVATAPATRGLVHADFGSNNLMAEAGAISGVIDWSEAMVGDPLYDVANHFFWRNWLDCMEAQAAFFENRYRNDSASLTRIRLYQLHIGLRELVSYEGEAAARMCEWIVAELNRTLETSGFS